MKPGASNALPGFFFFNEDVRDMFLSNGGYISSFCMMLYPRRLKY
jgi:hypothetical protein